MLGDQLGAHRQPQRPRHRRQCLTRVVLIVDIRRPMPFPFGAANRVAQEIMRRLYGRAILKKLA